MPLLRHIELTGESDSQKEFALFSLETVDEQTSEKQNFKKLFWTGGYSNVIRSVLMVLMERQFLRGYLRGTLRGTLRETLTESL